MTPLQANVDELAPRIFGPVTARWRQRQRFAVGFTHGSLRVEPYDPGPVDTQQPHTRDELHVIVSGRDAFERGDERVDFSPHDVRFVPAGEPHRFVDCTREFRT
jgi:mannose-6-phosphate isomerase-like protein (cupin superfamily)